MPRPDWKEKYRFLGLRRSQYLHPKIYGTTPREPSPRRLRMSVKFWALLAALIAAGALAWFFFASPAFAIQRIDIVGTVTPDVVAEIQSLQGRNLLAYSAGNMAERLKNTQSSIRDLEISKGLPDTLRIELVLRTPVLQWRSGETVYFIDERGEAFQRRLDTAPGDDRAFPEVVDTVQQPVTVGRPLVSRDFIEFLRTLDREFRIRFPVTIDHYELGQSTFQVTLVTHDSWRIFLDTTRSVDAQLGALKKIFEQFHDQIHEYVDLRVEDRAYFK